VDLDDGAKVDAGSAPVTPDVRNRAIEAARVVLHLGEQIEQELKDQRNRRIRTACSDVQLVVNFVYDFVEDDKKVIPDIRTAALADESYVEAFEKIRMEADKFSGCLVVIGQIAPTDEPVEKGMTDELVGLAHNLRQALDKAIDAFIAVVDKPASYDQNYPDARSNASLFAGGIRGELEGRRSRDEAQRDVSRRARDLEENAAAELERLGNYYENYADSETRTADWLRWAVAVLVAVIVAGAVWFYFRFGPPASLSTELVRLSVTIPVAALAAYCAHESSKHRKSAKLARELAIAMHTLPSYTESLGADGIELKRALGRRIFGEVVDRSETSVEDGLIDSVKKAVETAIGEMARRVQEMILGPKGNQ
jgi:hypothetical protein